jgi:hypothetical protein
MIELSVQLQNKFFFELRSAFSVFKHADSQAGTDAHGLSNSTYYKFVSCGKYDSEVAAGFGVPAPVWFKIPFFWDTAPSYSIICSRPFEGT